MTQKPNNLDEEANMNEKDSGFPVEVRPDPSRPVPCKGGHKQEDWINCYDIQSGEKNPKISPKRTPVRLHRGMQLRLSKEDRVQIGKVTYYRVKTCEEEPRAQNHYICDSDFIPAPEIQSSRPARARVDVKLQKIDCTNLKGKPIMGPTGMRMSTDTYFRVSTVHRITPQVSGSGEILADGNKVYHLIIECPGQVSAHGCFLKPDELEWITEEQYTARYKNGASNSPDGDRLQVRVAPRQGDKTVPLFIMTSPHKDGKKKETDKPAMVRLPKDNLSQGLEITVTASPTVIQQKEYYRILECPSSDYLGLYILVKDVDRIDIETSPAGSTGANP